MRITAIDIGKKNFAFANVDTNGNSECGYVKYIGLYDLTSGSSENIYKNLITYLDQFTKLWEETDIFLVEQQLNRMNIQATKIACHTHAYFMHKFPTTLIFEYPSSIKTKIFKFYSPSHRDRKKFAIDKVISLYKDTDPVLYDWLFNLRKHDDVADCILMCNTFHLTSLFQMYNRSKVLIN